MDIVFMVNLIK